MFTFHSLDCPECYRLIYVEVKKLRVSSAALADTIDRLRNGYIGDASFDERLANSKNTVSSLVSDAEESQEIEKNVTEQIKQLNETLNRLEEVLMQEVRYPFYFIYPFIHFLEDISNFCYLKFEVK